MSNYAHDPLAQQRHHICIPSSRQLLASLRLSSGALKRQHHIRRLKYSPDPVPSDPDVTSNPRPSTPRALNPRRAPADQRDGTVVAVELAVLAPVHGAVALVQARVPEAGQPRVVPRVFLRQPPPLLLRAMRSASGRTFTLGCVSHKASLHVCISLRMWRTISSASALACPQQHASRQHAS